MDGSVWITDSGSGAHHNIFTTVGGPLSILENVFVVDLGTGYSQFEIDAIGRAANITIGGSVSYDNSLNTANYDDVRIGANPSDGTGTVAIDGSLTLRLAHDAAHVNSVLLGGDGDETTPALTVMGPVFVVSGSTGDVIDINAALFKLGSLIIP